LPGAARGSTDPRKWGRVRLRLAPGDEVEAPTYESVGGRLLKILYSTRCRMDCRYCPFAVFCRRARSIWRREKLVRTVLRATREGSIRGLFLSSGLYRDPEDVTLELVETVEELRARGYTGYVHVKLMPGAPGWLIKRALESADRVSLNLEAASASSFSEIAPSKGRWSSDLYGRLLLAAEYAQSPAKVSTQLVVGAGDDTDREIIMLTWLLHRDGVGVVHYSPYTPVPGTPLAEKKGPVSPLRTGLLYEASRLLRDYGYEPRDFEPLLDNGDMLPVTTRSLKEELARAHPEWFPVDPARAPLWELLRVPGIGPRTASRIVEARSRGERITPQLLARLLGSARFRRAAPFLDLGQRHLPLRDPLRG